MMATTAAEEAPQGGFPKSVLSHRNKVAAARLRISLDRQLGVDTPQWIRDLAEDKSPGR